MGLFNVTENSVFNVYYQRVFTKTKNTKQTNKISFKQKSCNRWKFFNSVHDKKGIKTRLLSTDLLNLGLEK